MKALFIFTFAVMASGSVLKDYPHYNYEVLFTNPTCKEYSYDKVVYANDGSLLSSKPKNVYCKKSDFIFNESRPNSPHRRLLDIISSSDLKEIFLTYLSFSNKPIARALCEAVRRDVKVTLIIDSKNEKRASGRRQFDFISSCQSVLGNKAQTYFRGNKKGLGYAHNKIILAKFKSSRDKGVVIFSSGNMSSGTILHHENWHFVTTSSSSYFYQAHECIKGGMINMTSKKSFKNFLKYCRSLIQTEQESDIKVYAVPSDGKEAMANIVANFKSSISVDLAAHRFLHPEVINAMKKASASNKEVRFVVDDDIHWAGKLKRTVGSNMYSEYFKVLDVVKAGVNVKYMETNQNSRLLHHNKYIIFNYPDGTGAVHAGAGNFTKAAFTKNFENYYFIKIPEVVAAFRKQYEYKFNQMATSYGKLPAEYINP